MQASSDQILPSWVVATLGSLIGLLLVMVVGLIAGKLKAPNGLKAILVWVPQLFFIGSALAAISQWSLARSIVTQIQKLVQFAGEKSAAIGIGTAVLVFAVMAGLAWWLLKKQLSVFVAVLFGLAVVVFGTFVPQVTDALNWWTEHVSLSIWGWALDFLKSEHTIEIK